MKKRIVKLINFIYLDEKFKNFKSNLLLLIVGIGLLFLSINLGFGFVSYMIISLLIGLAAFNFYNKLGKKRHISFLDSELFKELKSNDFKVEIYEDYRGLAKNINGRTVRIYYDWNKRAKGPLSFGDIVIEFFYHPILTDKEEIHTNSEILYMLTSKYQNTFYSGYNLIFTPVRLVVNFNNYPWTNYSRIIKKINFYLEKLNDEKMKPIDIENMEDKLIKLKEEGQFLPLINIA